MRINNDRILLESLVRKYGINGVKRAIKKMNESLYDIDYERRGFETIWDFKTDLDERIEASGMTDEELEFIKGYAYNVYGAQDYVSDMNINSIYDEEVKEFAIKKRNRILAEIKEYVSRTDELREKYGRSLVSDIIKVYDEYSN